MSLKKIYIIAIIVAGISFFQFVLINSDAINTIQNLGAIIVFCFTLFLFLKKSPIFKNNSFNYTYILFIICLFLSGIGASLFWNQKFLISLTTAIPLFYWFFYYNLRYLKPNKLFIYKTIHFFGFLHAIFTLINIITYPNQYFGYKESFETYEIIIKSNFTGRAFMYISFLINVEKLLKKYSFKDIVLIIFYILVFLLMGRRIMLVSLILATIYLYIKISGLKIKYILLFAIIFIITNIFISKYYSNLFNNIIGTTQQQLESGYDYVRFIAAKYYLTDFSPNSTCYIIGNGIPSTRSYYGQFVKSIEENDRLFMADIGLIGFYLKTGIAGLASIIFMFMKFLKNKNINTQLFKAFTIFMIPMAIMNVEIVRPDTFILYSILMYLYDIQSSKINLQSTLKN